MAPEQSPSAATIRDNPAARRYEGILDGNVAGFVDYLDRRGRRILVHTEVDPTYAGRGVGNRHVAGALDGARASGLKVLIVCPFLRAFVERHPEYQPDA
ncbi:MAG: N-acetyltransferase [Chloroflexota bacterium]|nr:N-acetyltransferase [Chloroflexota bacterium]